MRWSAAVVVLLIFVVASMALNVYQYSSPRTVTAITTSTMTTTTVSQESIAITTTQTETLTGGSASSSVLSADGVQLNESVNATTMTVGQSLSVDVSLLNTLPETNTVHTSNDWLFQGVPVAVWAPCYFVLPVEVVVLFGSYTLQDLRTVANSTMYYSCMESVAIDHVAFQPDSDLANLTGVYDVTKSNGTTDPFNLSLQFSTRGYWDLKNLSESSNPPIIGEEQQPERPPAYTPFVPGNYTIAVADEWGQAVILHVKVAGPSNTIFGSFTYAPTGQVKVDSVWATEESRVQTGKVNVTFNVMFENVGSSPIYFIGGWVNELSSSVPANSTVLLEAPSQRCAGAIYITTLNPGQNYTVFAPDCSTGFNYQLAHSGSVSVRLSFNWTTDKQTTTPFSNVTTILANLTFP